MKLCDSLSIILNGFSSCMCSMSFTPFLLECVVWMPVLWTPVCEEYPVHDEVDMDIVLYNWPEITFVMQFVIRTLRLVLYFC